MGERNGADQMNAFIFYTVASSTQSGTQHHNTAPGLCYSPHPPAADRHDDLWFPTRQKLQLADSMREVWGGNVSMPHGVASPILLCETM